MSPTSSLAEFDALMQASEQRIQRRYNIKLTVHYKILKNGRFIQSGSGTVLNISSGGIFFECKQPPPLKVTIHLVLKWPILLDGVCPLNLLVRGHVLRSTPAGVAVKILSYDFHTTKRPKAETKAHVNPPTSRPASRLYPHIETNP